MRFTRGGANRHREPLICSSTVFESDVSDASLPLGTWRTIIHD